MADDNFKTAVANYLQRRDLSSALKYSLTVSRDTNPDYETKLRQSAAAIGVPLEAARADPDYVNSQAAAQSHNLDDMPFYNPVASLYLSDTQNAQIAHDDVAHLNMFETFGNQLAGWGSRTTRFSGDFTALIRPAIEGLERWNEMTGPKEMYGHTIYGDPVANEKFRNELHDSLTKGIRDMRANPYGYRPQTAWRGSATLSHPFSQLIPFVAEQGVQSVPDMMAAVFAPAVYAGEQTGDVAQTRADNNQVDAPTAGDYAAALPAGIVNTYLERLGVEKMVGGDVAVRSLGQLALETGKAALVEGGTEAVQQGIQDVAETVGTKKPFSLSETLNDMEAAAVAGAGIGGAVRATTGSVEIAGSRVAHLDIERKVQASAAVEQAMALDRVAESVQGSKTYQRSTEDFKRYADMVSDHYGISDVYLPAETFAQAMATPEGQAALAAMPEVAAQLEQAQATGVDVQVPYSDFVTNIAGKPDLYAQVRNDVRFEPEGMTRAEAEVAISSEAEGIKADFERELKKATDKEAFQKSTQAVIDDVRTQLEETKRYSRKAAAIYAELAGWSAASHAAREGITPEQLWSEKGFKVSAGGGDFVGALHQAGFELRPRQTGGEGQLGRSAREAVFDGATISYSAVQGGVHIDAVHVEKGQRRQGRARRAMEALTREADRTGTRLFLTAEPIPGERGPAKKTLTAFYKSLGFVENRGRNKVFDGPMAGMVREPRPVDTFAVEAQNSQLEQGSENDRGAPRTDGRGSVRTDGWPSAVSGRTRALEVANVFGDDTGRPVYEITDAGAFRDLILAAKASLGTFGAQVTAYDDYSGKRLFVFDNGGSGFALDGDDIISVFSTPGRSEKGVAAHALKIAVEQGGRRLDAFQTFLPGLYAASGFRAVAKLPFNREYAPADWDYDAVAVTFPNTGGAPDVVFMVYDPENASRDTDNVVSDYDEGNAAQAQALAERGYHQEPTSVSDEPRRGAFNPSTFVITLTKNADLSTFVHEMGHWHLEVLAHYANLGSVAAQRDMDALLNWFGITGQETVQGGEEGEQGQLPPGRTPMDVWNAMSLDEKRPYHEQFARGFERYLFENKAPTPKLRKIFQRISNWLVSLYRHSDAFRSELSDEVRQVMDRLVAAREDIAYREHDLGFDMPIDKPEGVSDEDWGAIQQQSQQATLDAQAKLQTRSLRDMKWLEGARSRALRRLQREAVAKRREVRDEVTDEVEGEPINQVRRFLSHGELPEDFEKGKSKAQRRQITEIGLDKTKLDLGVLKKMFGDGGAALWRYLRVGQHGYAADEGLHPDIVADMFGFSSGEQMVRMLVSEEKPRDKIRRVTDERMLERHGDLVDPKSVARAVDEAVHNEARTKALASTIAALDKSIGDKTVLLGATKQLAADVIGKVKIGDLRPDLFTAAEKREGRAMFAALKKGDVPAAVEALRRQLYNSQAAKASMKAKDEVAKTEEFFDSVVKAKAETTAKRRNFDIVNAARYILDAYGFTNGFTDVAKYMENVKAFDDILHDDLKPWIDAALADAPASRDIRDMTVSQLQALRDTIDQLWEMSARSFQMRREGELVDIAEAAREMVGDMPEGPGPFAGHGLTQALTPEQMRMQDFLGVLARFRRVEEWALFKGKNFHRNIFKVMSDRSLLYRELREKYRAQLLDNMKTIEDDLRNPTRIEAPEIAYTFGVSTRGGMAELIGALRHTGNDSNLRKLLMGRGWAIETADGSLDTSRWDALLDRLHKTGVLRKEHWDYVQSEWNLHEEIKPLAQKAHRAVYGRYFEEVKPREVVTPFGTYEGGYVPAKTDPRLVDEAALRVDEAALLGGTAGSFMFPSPANGFTKARNEQYAKALALDMALAGTQVDEVLKFVTMAEPVRDMLRLLKTKDLADKLRTYDPAASKDLLLPWIKRSATQTSTAPTQGAGGQMIDGAFRIIRQRAVMAMMFGNLTNTLANLTGIAPAMIRTGKTNMLRAMWQFMRTPGEMMKAVSGMSPFMADRLHSQMQEMQDNVRDIVEPKGAVGQVQDWSIKHTYVLQHGIQNVLDQVIWTAAYNRAVERNEADPVEYADMSVRTTQGSSNPVDISRYEAGPAWAKIFTTFSGYFLSQGNLMGTEFARAVASKSPKAVLNAYVLLVMVPSFGAWAIGAALRGGVEDRDKDGEIYNDLLTAFFGSQVSYLAGIVPLVGPVASAGINKLTGQSRDVSISASPVVSTVESAASAPFEIADAVQGKGKPGRAVRDFGELATMTTGIPATLVTRPASYATGVAAGDIRPTGPVDVVRGLLTGSASPASRQ